MKRRINVNICRSRQELSNESLLAKIGVDTVENEPLEVWGEIIQYYSFASLVLALRETRRGREDGAGGKRRETCKSVRAESGIEDGMNRGLSEEEVQGKKQYERETERARG